MTGHKIEINRSWETQISQGFNYLIVPPLVKACYGRGKKRFEELEYLALCYEATLLEIPA